MNRICEDKELNHSEKCFNKMVQDVILEKMAEKKMSLYELQQISGVAYVYCKKATLGEIINTHHLARICKVLGINYIFL